MRILLAFVTAVRFLTRIPLPGAHTESIGSATVFFPVVGALIGLLLAGVHREAERLWQNPMVSSVLVVVALVIVTGGLHLDGLMDVCDGVFGARTREQALTIMKDSRVGAFGALGAMCVLLLKLGFLMSLPPTLVLPALIVMPAAGRWACVYALYQFPYAREAGTGGAFKDQVKASHLLWATFFAVLVAGILFRWQALPLTQLVWVATWFAGLGLSRKLGGLTGDCYGAICEATEVLALAALPLITRFC